MHRNTRNSAVLAQRAHALRAFPTLSEAKLWQELKGRKLGVAFRRQVVLGSYIVDFVAHAVKLIVEVDGGYHARRRSADARRDRALVRAGYRVVRIDAQVVVARVGEAVAQIRTAIAGQR